MRLVILTAAILILGLLVLLGIVHLVRELLIKDFFQPPSLPGEAAIPAREAKTDAAPRSAGGIHT